MKAVFAIGFIFVVLFSASTVSAQDLHLEPLEPFEVAEIFPTVENVELAGLGVYPVNSGISPMMFHSKAGGPNYLTLTFSVAFAALGIFLLVKASDDYDKAKKIEPEGKRGDCKSYTNPDAIDACESGDSNIDVSIVPLLGAAVFFGMSFYIY